MFSDRSRTRKRRKFIDEASGIFFEPATNERRQLEEVHRDSRVRQLRHRAQGGRQPPLLQRVQVEPKVCETLLQL